MDRQGVSEFQVFVHLPAVVAVGHVGLRREAHVEAGRLLVRLDDQTDLPVGDIVQPLPWGQAFIRRLKTCITLSVQTISWSPNDFRWSTSSPVRYFA